MVVGAIHRPDPHNQNRNWHMHVDVYDRPARWLEKHGCWDFAYATKDRWGRTHFPLRQNKVALLTRSPDGGHHRYYGRAMVKAERARLVAILNEVQSPEAPRYVVGTYKENGIVLTPTAKLGTKATALEEKGVITQRGIANAHIAFGDMFRAADRRRREDDRALDLRLKKLARESLMRRPLDLDGIKNAIEDLKRLYRRRQEQEEFEIGVLMARARADTVLRSLDSKGYQARITKRAATERIAMRQAAEDRLVDIAGAIPSAAERERRATALERAIRVRETAMDRLVESRRERAVYRYPLVGEAGLPAQSRGAVGVDRWTPKREARLCAWLDRHGADPHKLAFGQTGIVLGKAVPQAVRTLFQDLIDRPVVQERLAECHRNQALTISAVERAVAVSPVVSSGAAVKQDTTRNDAGADIVGVNLPPARYDRSLDRTDGPAETPTALAAQVFDDAISSAQVPTEGKGSDDRHRLPYLGERRISFNRVASNLGTPPPPCRRRGSGAAGFVRFAKVASALVV